MPPGASGHTLWFQAAQMGQTSNVVVAEVE